MSTPYDDRRKKIEAAAPKERGGTIALVAALVGLLLVAGLLWAWMANRKAADENAAKVAGASAPPNATADGGGILANPGKAKDGAPTLVIFEDYQCPICSEVEHLVGPTVKKLADRGDIRLEYHIRSFLDQNISRAMDGKEPNPESSLRAAAATACADEAGVMSAYHDAVFAAQPEEGKGYTDQQLRETFATKAGLSGPGLTAFQKCVDDGAMKGFASKMDQVGGEQDNTGTPEYRLDGKTLPLEEIARDPSSLEKRVADATKK